MSSGPAKPVELPDLKDLTREILPPGLKVSLRSFRRRARQLGLAYVISRKTYVTPAQLAKIIESYHCVAQPKIDLSQMRFPIRLALDEHKQYEIAMRRLKEAERKSKRKK